MVFLRDHKVDCVTVGMRIEVQFRFSIERAVVSCLIRSSRFCLGSDGLLRLFKKDTVQYPDS